MCVCTFLNIDGRDPLDGSIIEGTIKQCRGKVWFGSAVWIFNMLSATLWKLQTACQWSIKETSVNPSAKPAITRNIFWNHRKYCSKIWFQHTWHHGRFPVISSEPVANIGWAHLDYLATLLFKLISCWCHSAYCTHPQAGRPIVAPDIAGDRQHRSRPQEEVKGHPLRYNLPGSITHKMYTQQKRMGEWETRGWLMWLVSKWMLMWPAAHLRSELRITWAEYLVTKLKCGRLCVTQLVYYSVRG